MRASKLGMSIATAALLAVVAVGHAQQAQQDRQAQKAPQATNATAAAASSTATTASKATTDRPSADKSSDGAQAPDSGLSVELLREARDDGFKPVTRHNVTLYCKSEIIVGSAFPVHTCYNADRLKVVLEQYRAERMQLQQMHSSGMQGH